MTQELARQGSRKRFATLLVAGAALLIGLSLAFLSQPLALRALGIAMAVTPFIVMSVSDLKRVLLAVMLLEIAFPADIYIGRRPDQDHLNAISGFNISVTTFCLLGLYILWAAERAAVKGGRPTALRETLPALAYTGAVVGSVAVAQDPTLPFFEIVIVMQALLILLYLVHAIRTRRDLLFVFALLMVGLAIQALVVIMQATIGLSLQVGLVRTSMRGVRPGGIIGGPNGLGSYLTLLLGPALGLVLARLPRIYRYLGVVAFALGSLALIYSLSRGAWAGFLVSGLLVLAVAYGKGWVNPSALVSILVLGASVILAIFGSAILTRLGSGATVEGRLELAGLAWSMIRDHPLLGVGANHFAASLDPYFTVDYTASWVSTVHNKYLLVWAETGLVGLSTFLWLLLSSIRRAWHTSQSTDTSIAPLAIGLLAGIVANMIHMGVALFHSRSQTQMLWIVLALTVAVWNISRAESTFPLRRAARSA